MTPIPPDIQEAADMKAATMFDMRTHTGRVVSSLLAQALLAEREAATKAERERAAGLVGLATDQEIRLACGEMTAQEMRTAKAVLKWRAAAIRSAP